MSSPTLEQRLAARNRPDGGRVMSQRWARLLFLHWQVEADLLRATLPSGLHLDTFQEEAYLGIVPFFMERVRPRFLPPVPGLSWFLELNLRTYVHDDEGRPGVWFYSLDANQALAVELARKLFHLPYQHARMSAEVEKEQVAYRSARKSPAESPEARYHYAPSGALQTAEPGSREFFLLERYLLFSVDGKRQLKVGQVHHEPYPFQEAACPSPSKLPFTWNEFPEPKEDPCSVLYSPGVEVEVFPLRRV